MMRRWMFLVHQLRRQAVKTARGAVAALPQRRKITQLCAQAEQATRYCATLERPQSGSHRAGNRRCALS